LLDGSASSALSVTEDLLPLGLGGPERAVVARPVVAGGLTARLWGLWHVVSRAGRAVARGVPGLLLRVLRDAALPAGGAGQPQQVTIVEHLTVCEGAVFVCGNLFGGGPCVRDWADVNRTGARSGPGNGGGAANDAV
jgi:hypothetical protein